MIHSFPRGASIRLALENMDSATFSAPPVAKIKAMYEGRAFGPVLGTFTTEAKTSLGTGLGPGWVFTLNDDLPIGDYVVDAALTMNGETLITLPVTVKVTGSANG